MAVDGDTNYPTGLDTFDDTKADSDLVGQDVADHSAALTAIEAELGALPSGDAADVGERIETVESGRVDAWVTKEAPVNPTHPEYGFDGAASAGDNATALQAAVDALPANGGDVFIPGGGYAVDALPSLEDKRNVKVFGEGGHDGTGGLTNGTRIAYTGTGAGEAWNWKKAKGCRLESLVLKYSDPAFTGYLIEMDNDSGSGANDTAHNALRDVILSGDPSPSAVNAAALVHADHCHSLDFDNVSFMRAEVGLLGQSSGGYASALRFGRCHFEKNTEAHLKNGGGDWLVEASVFEPLTDGSPGAYKHDAAVRALGLTFLACWFGDLSAAGDGSHIIFSGDALVVLGNAVNCEFAATGFVELDENDCQGLLLGGNRHNGDDWVVKIGSTTGHTGIILPNEYVSVTAVTSGTVPTGLHNFNSAGALVGLTMAAGITMGSTGSIVSRLQAATNEFLVSRTSGAAADTRIDRHNGHIWRGSGAATPIGQVGLLFGTGSPEGAVVGGVGSLYQRSDGGAGTSLYVKESGTGNTGWKALVGV